MDEMNVLDAITPIERMKYAKALNIVANTIEDDGSTDSLVKEAVSLIEVLTGEDVGTNEIKIGGELSGDENHNSKALTVGSAKDELKKQLAIADKLETEYGYLPALNGERSKLNKQQWAQVRTPQFKAWFGDWEVASGRLTKIATTFAEAREFVKEFQGKELVNKSSGIRSTVSRKNLDKMLSAKAVGKSETAAIHATAVANIDNIFERAVLGWSKKDSESDPNIKFIHRFFAPVVVMEKQCLQR